MSKLNDIKVKALKPKKKLYRVFDGQGLYIEISPTGSKYWRLKYRMHGKERRMALGVYPEISLKEARAKKDEARRLIDDHIDPSKDKKRKKAQSKENEENSFEAIAREWYELRKDQWKPRYAEEVIKRLEDDIFPLIGDYPIKDIEPPLLLSVMRRIEKRGAFDLAKRQNQKCGEIFRYAIASGKAIRDPSQDIGEALKPVKKTHFAALEVDELPEFLAELNSNKARLYPSTINALKLIMLTFVRTNELINARWEEIDFEKRLWTIPAERMKMGKPHIVPLADQTIEILKNQKELADPWPLVFPSAFKKQKSISNNTILGAIKRLGYQGRMTGHGFRALAMSAIKQELGYRHEVVDRQLAHVPKSKIDRAYDRAMFLEERKKMMQDWADYIDRIVKC